MSTLKPGTRNPELRTQNPAATSMKPSKIARYTLALLPALIGAGMAALYYVSPYMITTPRKIKAGRTPGDLGLPYETISVTTADSLVLRGYWVREQADTGRTAILLLHGIGNSKEGWLETAAWLWEEGYETLLIDGRAHGESDGQFCTYGYCEKHDVSAILDEVLRRDSTARVGVWGNSLGGAIALQALAAEPRLRFGLVQSTFADFRTIVFDYQCNRFYLPWRWWADQGIARAAAMASFEPDSIRPGEAARRVHQPVLLAHGDADDRIKVEYGKEIFANLASREKELHIIPGADHLNVMQRGGDPFREAVLAFLERHR
jgi:pimeloyl-ACP methyl ester carboxylesterase